MEINKEDKNIINDIIHEPIDSRKVKDILRLQIYDELEKNDGDINFDLIEENIGALMEMDGQVSDQSPDLDKKILEIKKAARQKEKKKFRRIPKIYRVGLATCCIVAVLFAGNLISARAFNFNFIDKVIQYGANYIGFNFNGSPHTTVDENQALFDEIKKECQKYDMAPLFPTDMPKDMMTTSISCTTISGIEKDLSILLKNQNTRIKFLIKDYDKQPTQLKDPGSADVEKFVNNGITFYIAKNSGQYTVTFESGNYVYFIYTNLSHDDIIQALNSLQSVSESVPSQSS